MECFMAKLVSDGQISKNLTDAILASVPKKEKDAEKKVQEFEKKQLSDVQYVEEFGLQDLFGSGFTPSEYVVMHKKYLQLQNNYPLRTEMHKEALVTYVKYGFKRDKAIASDDMDAADKWGKLAAKQASDAKINPNQLSAADLSEGISNFSKLVEAVERAQDIIPILPKYKETPLDKVDYTIWQYVNYIRRLQNMPDIKYSDLYKYLDEQFERNKKDLPYLTKEQNGHYDETEEDL